MQRITQNEGKFQAMKKVLIGLVAVVLIFGSSSILFSHIMFVKSPLNKDVFRLLKEIHDEVVLLGKYPG